MRPLAKNELNLVLALLKLGGDDGSTAKNLDKALVEPMLDGGMGSLKFYYPDENNHVMAKEFVTAEANDKDNVLLSIAVNLNSNKKVCELDVWKVDFSPLIEYPLPRYLRLVEK